MASIQITSTNYNGQTAQVTFYSVNAPNTPVNLGPQTIPYSRSGNDVYGSYELNFTAYNKVCIVALNGPTTTTTTTTAAPAIDPYFANVALLLNFDSTTSIIDHSINSHPVSINDPGGMGWNVLSAVNTSNTKWGVGAIKLPIMVNYETASINGTEDFTVEAWVYPIGAFEWIGGGRVCTILFRFFS